MIYPEKIIVGLMSGTSLDGLDIVACKFWNRNEKWAYEVLKTSTEEYSLAMKEKLKGLMQTSALELTQEDFAYGYFLGERIAAFLSEKKIKADYIASHGHTIFHQPENGFTLQIGKGACIAAKTGLPVVYDFRSLDVAMGGQGAPLVPLGDKLLFREYTHCLNLGGIANISFDCGKTRHAYDICPVNMVLNALAGEKGCTYDKDGILASSGKVNAALLEKLEALEFYKRTGPKSLGKEWVDRVVLPLIAAFSISTEDKLATFCRHIALRIAATIEKNAQNKVLVTGGGAFNTYLIRQLEINTAPSALVVPDEQTVIFKEAIIFAFLGYLRILNIPNCLSSVTGAKRDTSSGNIVHSYNG